jgi:hypothetical protein
LEIPFASVSGVTKTVSKNRAKALWFSLRVFEGDMFMN